ncbi:UNVERIFIED_CONTAM: hypothetical protein Sradi_2053900 [Sesamum radiatum]|uniref:Transposase n=1 Tax=Sesamum radiatum TaxID=300843 RepID=A0AAW2TKM8_SESRA
MQMHHHHRSLHPCHRPWLWIRPQQGHRGGDEQFTGAPRPWDAPPPPAPPLFACYYISLGHANEPVLSNYHLPRGSSSFVAHKRKMEAQLDRPVKQMEMFEKCYKRKEYEQWSGLTTVKVWVIHYLDKESRLHSIDPDKYSFFDIMDDIRQLDAVEFPNATGRKIVFEKGMIFTDVNAFRDALREFVTKEGFRMKRYRNETQRVTAGCDLKGCSWRIHASPLGDGVTFQIKTYFSVHTCIRSDNTKEASAKWMALKLVNVLRDNISMDVKVIRTELKKFGINPPYMQIYRARKKALEEIDGGHANSFAKLPYYAHMVSVTNEGSIATLQCDIHDDRSSSSIHVAPSFKKFFLGLSALRDGFKTGCNPFIEFDGCHLKGPFGGVLLAAISLDGNKGLFPIAFAIGETECKKSWMFFFENLSNMLGGFCHDRPWTFMSDRQKGLVGTINEVVPHAIHRRCARHIYANFRHQFAGAASKKYFWQSARSYDVVGFNFAMYKVKELNPAAYDWLMKIPAEQWSRHAFDPRLKNDHVTNNISESFNH